MIKKLLLSLLEINSEDITGTTGKKAVVSGIYRSGKEFIALTKGETFPPVVHICWNLVVSV
jgi:hypothetical protein